MALTAKVLAQPVPPPPEERRRQIEAEPLPLSVWGLIEEAAAEVPDLLLWDFFEEGEQATYAEVHEQVTRLAGGLSARGVSKGTVVGVMLPNIPAWPITWFALARLGAIVVPVNVRYTSRELQFVLANSGAGFLIVHADFLSVAGEALEGLDIPAERMFVAGGPKTEGQERWEDILGGGHAKDLPEELPGRDDLLNIQYTSGTTGMPKGCMLTHRHWLTCGKVNARRDGRVYRRILASTPFFYMDPQWLLLMTVFQRATLYVAERQSATKFMDWVRRHRIEFCLFPELVLKQPPLPEDADNALIRVNIYGIRRTLHADLERRFDVVAREAFGMTELGSAMFMPMEAEDMVGSGSCGIPSPFRECRIVDETGQELPAGEIGELQLRGPGMMLGYYKNPAANEAAFDGDWFRSGDLFQKDERGYYYIVGRLKDIIRRSGENIAAREIEEVLLSLNEITEAAAVGVPDETRGEEVKAYLVLQPGLSRSDLPPARILEHCRVHLASFKVPRYISFCGALPKTPSGKISKAVLRGAPDPFAGAYDRVEARWLEPGPSDLRQV